MKHINLYKILGDGQIIELNLFVHEIHELDSKAQIDRLKDFLSKWGKQLQKEGIDSDKLAYVIQDRMLA